jgi:hypothetical protein
VIFDGTEAILGGGRIGRPVAAQAGARGDEPVSPLS